MQIDDLPPLRDVIASHGLDAKKSLGQNFLLDLNLTSKIARLAGDISGHDVLEVGPGPGGLTRGLLARWRAPGRGLGERSALHGGSGADCCGLSGPFGCVQRRCFGF